MKSVTSALVLTAVLGLGSTPATAGSFKAGTITFGLGLGLVDPKSDNGTLPGVGQLDIGSSTRPTITGEYFIRDNLGIELLGALPFKHSISIAGLGEVGSTKQLPPVISLQYHVPTAGAVTPFFGAGLNYTWFFDEKATGALAGSQLKLSNSFGVALHAGVDLQVSPKGWLRADVRWADIKTDVKVNGTKLGTAKVNPMVFGISYVMRF